MELWDDARGQSVQVGVVLLFAVLVILLATYQATVVPNENRAAEFEHSLDAERDLLDARNAIVDAYQDGSTAPVSIKLGMTYPRHTFGVNPAPVSGELYSSANRTVAVTDGADDPVDACPVTDQTKTLTYAADYNYYQPKPTLVYENTVLYADYGEDNTVLISDQSLVTGSTVNLVTFQGDVAKNGLSVTDFQPVGGKVRSTRVTDPSLEVPTNLSKARWERLLTGEVDDPDAVTVSDGTLTVDLTGSYTVRCGVVGADQAPPGGERSSDDGSTINPTILRLQSVDLSGSTATLTINNTGGTANFTSGRINYYSSTGGGGGGQPTTADVLAEDGTQRGTFAVGGDLSDVSPPIELKNETTTDIVLDFDSNINQGQDWFVVSFYTESGEQQQYFVG